MLLIKRQFVDVTNKSDEKMYHKMSKNVLNLPCVIQISKFKFLLAASRRVVA